MNEELLKKYCKNACTEKELNSVLEWFEEPDRTHEGKALLFQIWEKLHDEDNSLEINFDFILDKIHHKINLDQSKKLLEKADQNIIKYKRRKHFINILVKAAAILMLPVLCFGLYMSSKYQMAKYDKASVNQAYYEVFSSVDAITKVALPDGSIVWLNHNSSIKYPSMFRGNTRSVMLNGEGFFEVAHNSKIPFTVKVGEIEVKATGTTFNIMAYPDEDRIETSLINGRIELQRAEPDGKVISLITMKPAEMVVFQKSNSEINTHVICDNRYFSWKDGKLVFNKEPMSEVVKKLSRWFNVDIQIKDTELLELTYTATFVQETLPQVMELIAMVSPVSYSISSRQEMSPGTFSKRKVILRYRK